ncbi:hypothetical protein ACWELB_21190 [Streptomyces asiaticus]
MTDRYPLACTKSEYRHLKPITCRGCGLRYRPIWTPTTDLGDEVDPSGVLGWVCPNEGCGHNPLD